MMPAAVCEPRACVGARTGSRRGSSNSVRSVEGARAPSGHRASGPAFRPHPGRPSDEELLCRYRDTRNPGDFAELVGRYAGALYRYLSRYLGDPALAEDVLQDTFLRVHAKCHLFRDGWHARAWLYSVATRRAIDTLRALRRQSSTIDVELSDETYHSVVDLLATDEPGPLDELFE
jgi:RNA polymerase sigma-70 factor (ECF subfamily)